MMTSRLHANVELSVSRNVSATPTVFTAVHISANEMSTASASFGMYVVGQFATSSGPVAIMP